MPTIQGIPGFQLITSSANPTQGIPYTRFKGVALSGTIGDSVTSGPGPVPPAGGFVLIQSTASISNQVVSTAAPLNASYHYLAVTTATAVNWVSSNVPPFTGCGSPVLWNDNAKTLQCWSSGSSSWMTPTVLATAVSTTSGATPTAQPVTFTTS